MIRADIAEIEKLTDLLTRAASDADEAHNKLRRICSEMHEDIELATFPQTPIALEAVDLAVETLNRGSDTLQSLRSVMLPVADAYRENEQKQISALNRMTVIMNNAAVSYHAAVVSEGIAHVEHTDEVISQAKIQQLVADSAAEMQIANIAAITKTVKEEYEVTAVVDGGV